MSSLSGGHYYPETSPIMTIVPACVMAWGTSVFPVAIDGRADIYGGCAGSISFQLIGPGSLTIHQVDNGHAVLSMDGQDLGTLSGGCFAGNAQTFVVAGAGAHNFRIDRFADDYNLCQYASWGFDGIDWTGEPAALPTDAGDPDTTQNNNYGTAGDPVQSFTGAFLYERTDIAIAGRGPVPTFQRSYNGKDERIGRLGPGWVDSYDVRLRIPLDTSGDVYYVGPGGNTDRFTHQPDGSYAPPPATYRNLTAIGDGTYSVTDKALTVQTFNADGYLTSITDGYGNTSTLGYNSSGLLLSVSDPAGRGSLTFGYTFGYALPRVSAISDWSSPARTVTYGYDATGRLRTVTDREGKVTTFGYDGTSSRLNTITDANSHVALTLTYDAQGRVASQKDARGLITGDQTTFGYADNGGTRVTTTTHAVTSFEPAFHPTVVDTYDLSTGWLLARESHPSSTETLNRSYTYDASGNRTSETDYRGNRTDFCYDVSFSGAPIPGSRGNQTRRIEPPTTTGTARPVTLTAYDASSNVIQAVSPKGVASGASVGCTTDLSSINVNHATDFGYDAARLKLMSVTTRYTDPDTGTKTAIIKYEYGDAANPGRRTRIIPPRGNTTGTPDYSYATTMTYYTTGSRAGLLQSVADALGNTTTYDYDASGRMIASVDPIGNAAGGVPAEHTTNLVYDKEDRVGFLKVPPPIVGGSQLVTETRYDSVGNPIAQIDAAGQVTSYSYTERDALFQAKESPSLWTDPAAPPSDVVTTEFAYDAAGNLTRVTRAKGDSLNERATDYSLDGRGLVRQERQYPGWPSTSSALTTAATYDPNGNLATVADPMGMTTTNGYDNLDRLTAISYSDGITPNASFSYDANGNRTTRVDGSGTTTFAYDEARRLVSEATPGPKTVGYRYDLDGNRTKLIYPDASAVSYTFDKSSQMTGLQDWASRSVAYTYYPDRAVKTATNPNGTVATFSYDNARRLFDIKHTLGSTTIDRRIYKLDPVGSVLAVSGGAASGSQTARPDAFVSSNGSWTGTYASINEVTPNDSTFLASPSGPTSASYYEVGMSDPQAPYDPNSLLVRYRYAKSGNNNGQTINLTVEVRQGVTVIATRTHLNIPGATGSGWLQATMTLTAAEASTISNFSSLRLRFRPVASGSGQARVAQVSWAQYESGGAAIEPSSYTYDREGRLVTAVESSGTTTYGYDPVGNRKSSAIGGNTTVFTYDRADRVTSAGSSTVTVNANGNMSARGSDTFSYDQANRLKTATVSGATETYAYDGDGGRFSRQIGAGTPVRFVTDGSRGLPVTLDDGPRKYVYGLGLAYAVSGASVEVYHPDRLGSIRVITNAAGVVTDTYRTDVWGNVTGGAGSSTQPFAYVGEPRDATGLSYLRARYYDPSLGRFISRDTLGGNPTRVGTLNRYSYVLNSPASLLDPSGRSTTSAVLGGKVPNNQAQNRMFNAAMKACEKALGKEIANTNRQRQLHDSVHNEPAGDFEAILQRCMDLFGPATEPEPETEPETYRSPCTSDANWDETCRVNPFGGFRPLPVGALMPFSMPQFQFSPFSGPVPVFGL